MKVLITGMGAYCALGSTIDELWDAITEGRSGIGPIKRFDVTQFESKLGGMIPGGDHFDSDDKRLLYYAEQAASEALKNAKINDYANVSLVLGTSNGVKGKDINYISYKLSDMLNLGGLVITVSTACTSSAHAIGFAADLIRQGDTRIVIAGGADILTRDVFAGFHNLGLLSKIPCSPFSASVGTTLGEGAAFLVLETEETANQRGIKQQAIFLGYGISSDAYHDTKPDPSGSGVCVAIANALKDSDLRPENIDYLNAHGTGTAANDSAEWRGIQCALGSHSVKMPVSSSKSFLGHTQGAAGALEAVITIRAMQHDVIPPTLNYTRPRPSSPSDPVAAARPRPHITKNAICTNSAFGGVNTALVFGRDDTENQACISLHRPISVLGYGFNLDEHYIEQFIPYDDLRSTDRSARLLAGAVAMVLNKTGIQFRSNLCENVGLFAGQNNLSPESVEAFESSVRDRGIKRLSASAFTRMVINYPAGVCCRLFGMKGPVAAFSVKPDSGIAALCLGADFLSSRYDTDHLIIATVEEPEKGSNKPAWAASVLLKAGIENYQMQLRGWSMSGNICKAIENALATAKLKASDATPVKMTISPTSHGLYDLFEMIDNKKNEQLRTFLITCEQDLNSIGLALIIERKN
jgi:3-oxoacyl-[acyl-carrier-protein] synthase II